MIKVSRVSAWIAVTVSLVIGFIGIVGGLSGKDRANAATSGLTMAATIQPSMTIVLSDASKTLSITPSSDGTFSSTSIMVGAYSNGSIGYTLTMTPSSTALAGSDVTTIPTLTADSTCSGGDTCTSSNFAVGYWGIAVDNEVYKPASARNITTVSSATTTSITTNNTHTINLGANLDLNVPIDTYSTTLNFALVSSSIAQYDVTFNYDSNFISFALEDASGNTMTPTSTGANTKTYSLDYAGTYTVVADYATRYGFGTMSLSSGSGFINSDTLAYTVGGASTVALTSQRQPLVCNPSGTTISAIVCMQDITDTNRSGVISSMTASTNYTLYDSRDEEEYTVALLADNKVWMTKNLNLAGGTKLYSETSDVPSGYPESGNTGYYQLPASATKNDGNANLTDSTQFSDDSGSYVFNSGNNTTTCNSSDPCNSYYSWLTATAGGKDSSGNAVTGNGYNAAYSICPKGWRLPTSTTSNANPQQNGNWKTGDFYTLATAYGADLESNYYVSSNTFYNNAGPNTTIPKFLLTGYYDSGSFNNGGSRGYYWSATSVSSTRAYYLNFDLDYVSLAYGSSRRAGFSVRCVLGS